MSEWKQKRVENLTEQIKKSKVVGVLTVRNLPSKQLQQMRTKLPADIAMAKKNLMLRALKDSKKKGIKDLEQYITDQPAFIFADENPFKLCSIIAKNKSPAPAKGGDIAPNDIVIEKGDTPFQPGPVLGEMKGVGIPCAIEGGKIVISETKTILKAGEEINPKLAEMLGRLGIEPMEIGLELLACYEGGSVFPKDVLAVDDEEYFNNFIRAYKHTLNLSVESAFPTSTNIEILVQKCYSNSKGLSIEAGILNSATVGDILGKASRAAGAISGMVKDAPAAEAKPAAEKPATEEKTDEKPAEEKPAAEKPAEEKPAEAEPKSEAEAPAEKKADEKPAESKSSFEGEKQEAEAAAPTGAPSEAPKAEEKPQEEKPQKEKPEEQKSEEPQQEAKED